MIIDRYKKIIFAKYMYFKHKFNNDSKLIIKSIMNELIKLDHIISTKKDKDVEYLIMKKKVYENLLRLDHTIKPPNAILKTL